MVVIDRKSAICDATSHLVALLHLQFRQPHFLSRLIKMMLRTATTRGKTGQTKQNKKNQKKQDWIKERWITASYLPSDGDDQTLSCLQLQLGFIQQQTQHLQNLRVFRANIGKWHPVYIPCKCVQCRHSHSTESSDLWAKKREGGLKLMKQGKAEFRPDMQG